MIKHNNADINAGLLCRFGYFGREEKAAVRLFLCKVSGCLTNNQIYTSVSGEDLVAVNARDVAGVQMFHQVILISSVNEPLSRGLLEKVSQLAGCGLRIGEQQKGLDVERLSNPVNKAAAVT